MSKAKELVILCGGQGTRLGEETKTKSKPLVEIGGKLILWHIMKLYSSYGVKRLNDIGFEKPKRIDFGINEINTLRW